MEQFIGREHYLRQLTGHLADVRASGQGRILSVRGRRRVGKSRLLEEWLRREQVSHVFFAASRQAPQRELALFSVEVATSTLPGASTIAAGVSFDSWEAALTFIGTTVATPSLSPPVSAPPGQLTVPAVVVLDEFPYLMEQDRSIEASIQKVYDRLIRRVPLLLILVGSDVSMMESLSEYGRPLYGRQAELVVHPLTPPETAEMLDLDAVDALDAYLVVGGFPLIVQTWRKGATLWQFLERELGNATSPMIVTGERILAAEFPTEAQARQVLTVIGSGETTFTAIGSSAGVPQKSLTRSLDLLVKQKRIVAAIRPLSSRPSRESRYLVADPYLRFWLRFIQPSVEEIERGRADLVLADLRASWSTYRGKAIEPLVRDAVEQILPDSRFGDARYVGGYWTRTNDVEVDLVGVREHPVPERVVFVGSIKWKERARFERQDLAALIAQRAKVPGTDEQTLLVAVSRSGAATAGLDVSLGPSDMIEAWQPFRP